jgi:hypothetical protein
MRFVVAQDHALVDRAQGLANRRTGASRAVVGDDGDVLGLALALGR